MLLKLTEAALNPWQLIGHLEPYVYVNFAAVAYMQRRSVTWKRSKPTAEHPRAVEDVETLCTLICFNSATHDDMNSVYVVESPEEIMALSIPRVVMVDTIMADPDLSN